MSENTQQKLTQTDMDDINYLDIFFVLWNRKYLIILFTLLFTVVGVIYAIYASPVYYSQAVIALKESEKQSGASAVLSSLGGVGGLVASQFGLGNSSLDKIEIILTDYEMSEKVIKKYNLMPVLFPDKWDKKLRQWKENDSMKIPQLHQGIFLLRKTQLKVAVDDKRKVIKLGCYARDSVMSKNIVNYFLSELGKKLLADVKRDAVTNRAYLEEQLNNTSDPGLAEKIANMIAFEIEKYMLAGTKPFEILNAPVIPHERAKPKKVLIVLLSFLSGLFITIFAVFAWNAVAKARKNYVCPAA